MIEKLLALRKNKLHSFMWVCLDLLVLSFFGHIKKSINFASDAELFSLETWKPIGNNCSSSCIQDLEHWQGIHSSRVGPVAVP
jgi:hypothetical protein